MSDAITPEMKDAALQVLEFQAGILANDKNSLSHGMLFKPDSSVIMYASYTRKGKKIQRGEIKWKTDGCGRFAFDLRHRNIERAIADALSRRS